MDYPNPWKTLSIHRLYENPWIRLEEHEVINPQGRQHLYGKVCFKNRAVAVVPLDEQKNTWLVGQYRYTLGAYSWEVPAGGSPQDEPLETTARRELAEETGLLAARIEPLMDLHTSNSVTDEAGFIFLATELEQGPPNFEDTEDITIKKLPLEEAVALVMDGTITDGLSVAALLKLAVLEHSGRL